MCGFSRLKMVTAPFVNTAVLRRSRKTRDGTPPPALPSEYFGKQEVNELHRLKQFSARTRTLSSADVRMPRLILRILPLQQLHQAPSLQNYDDLTGAVTNSASKRAIMMLFDIFVLALEYIKGVRKET